MRALRARSEALFGPCAVSLEGGLVDEEFGDGENLGVPRVGRDLEAQTSGFAAAEARVFLEKRDHLGLFGGGDGDPAGQFDVSGHSHSIVPGGLDVMS